MPFSPGHTAKADAAQAHLELGADGILRASGDWIVSGLTGADAEIAR